MNKVTLLTTLCPSSEARNREFARCLINNISNPYIERIVILSEFDQSPDFGILNELLSLSKIFFIRIPGRPTFFDFFQYANQHCAGKKVVIANSDIYFDNSLSNVLTHHKEDDFFVLTRWTKSSDQKSYLPQVFNSSYPIDQIDYRNMVSLRWWSPCLHPLYTWHEKNQPIDDYNSEEFWLSKSNIFDEVFDYNITHPSSQAPGVNRADGELIYYRNEHSADAWIFEAPFIWARHEHSIPIGTFRCDTFLNYFLINDHIKSRINLSNPCLTIRSFHQDFLRSEEDKNYIQKNIQEKGFDKFEDNYEFSPTYDANLSEDPEKILHRCFVPWCSLQK